MHPWALNSNCPTGGCTYAIARRSGLDSNQRNQMPQKGTERRPS